jgi:hypothetical protein
MTKLAFEDIDDARVRRPYLFVFLLEDHQTYWVGQFSPFMQVNIGEDDELTFNFYEAGNAVSLSEKHWEEILQTARQFRAETLARGDD